MTMTATPENIKNILDEAYEAARGAVDKFYKEELKCEDQYPCGFAWVNIKVKRSTKLGKALVKEGLKYNEYEKCLYDWNPGQYRGQNMYCIEAGARAFAEVLQKYNIPSVASSRLD